MNDQRTQQRLAEYLTVGEAAKFLGVSPWTLRNWDKAGKLRPSRHPKNSYRIYRREDLDALLAIDAPAHGANGKGVAAADWHDLADGAHVVQFYETEPFLADAVAA